MEFCHVFPGRLLSLSCEYFFRHVWWKGFWSLPFFTRLDCWTHQKPKNDKPFPCIHISDVSDPSSHFCSNFFQVKSNSPAQQKHMEKKGLSGSVNVDRSEHLHQLLFFCDFIPTIYRVLYIPRGFLDFFHEEYVKESRANCQCCKLCRRPGWGDGSFFKMMIQDYGDEIISPLSRICWNLPWNGDQSSV